MTRNPVGDNEAFSAVYWSAILNAHDFDFVRSGCQPSAGTGSWEVDISSGEIVAGGSPASPGSQTVTHSAADGSNPRVDIVTINDLGNASVTEGTAASDPLAPDIPSGEVLICAVFLPAGASSISTGNINDYRVFSKWTDYPIDTDDIATAAITSDEIATGAVKQAEIASNAVGSGELKEYIIDEGKLTFDPATQDELDAHEGNSSAHHSRPSVTQDNDAPGYAYAWEDTKETDVPSFGDESHSHRINIAGEVPTCAAVWIDGRQYTGTTGEVDQIEVRNNNTNNVLGTGEGEHTFSPQPVYVWAQQDGGSDDGWFRTYVQWKIATTTQHSHDI